ncbi:MAG: hypothetical protein IH956_06315 [Chloroflexi bacterium]|nr:hypothetical protein [Chloroflexota bacterium]
MTAIYPNAKVLFTWGYGEESIGPLECSRTEWAFTPESLAELVGAVLER